MKINKDAPPNLACPYCHQTILIILPWQPQIIGPDEQTKLDDHKAVCPFRDACPCGHLPDMHEDGFGWCNGMVLYGDDSEGSCVCPRYRS